MARKPLQSVQKKFHTGVTGFENLGMFDCRERLNVAPRTICVWAKRGKIPAFKIGKLWRFQEARIRNCGNESRRVRVEPEEPIVGLA